jgi:YihY family inner membrane protein
MKRSSQLAELSHRLWLCGNFAAAMAFFFALSLVPFVALSAMAAVSWLPRELGFPLAETLTRVFPTGAGIDEDAITHWVRSARGSGWLAVGIGFAVWTTARFMMSSLSALGYLVTGRMAGWRRSLLSALAAVPLVLVWMLTVLVASFFVLFGAALTDRLAATDASQLALATSAVLPAVPSMVMLVLALALTYRAAPGLEARWRRLFGAAILATAGSSVVALVFTRLIPAIWKAKDMYGAMASFLLFMTWCYWNAWVLLIGGLLAASGTKKS